MADPENFTATPVGSDIVLSCDESPTPDVYEYHWFRRTPPTAAAFDPETDTPIAVTAGPDYTDNTVTSDVPYEYQVFGNVLSRFFSDRLSSDVQVDQVAIARSESGVATTSSFTMESDRVYVVSITHSNSTTNRTVTDVTSTHGGVTWASIGGASGSHGRIDLYRAVGTGTGTVSVTLSGTYVSEVVQVISVTGVPVTNNGADAVGTVAENNGTGSQAMSVTVPSVTSGHFVLGVFLNRSPRSSVVGRSRPLWRAMNRRSYTTSANESNQSVVWDFARATGSVNLQASHTTTSTGTTSSWAALGVSFVPTSVTPLSAPAYVTVDTGTAEIREGALNLAGTSASAKIDAVVQRGEIRFGARFRGATGTLRAYWRADGSWTTISGARRPNNGYEFTWVAGSSTITMHRIEAGIRTLEESYDLATDVDGRLSQSYVANNGWHWIVCKVTDRTTGTVRPEVDIWQGVNHPVYSALEGADLGSKFTGMENIQFSYNGDAAGVDLFDLSVEDYLLYPSQVGVKGLGDVNPAPWRSFITSGANQSYWNRPLPTAATVHPNSAGIIEWMQGGANFDPNGVTSGPPVYNGRIGLNGNNGWGIPVYAQDDAGAQAYDIIPGKVPLGSSMTSVRIPKGVRLSDNSDREIVVYDFVAGFVLQLYQADYWAAQDAWTCGGGRTAYLDGSGLQPTNVWGDPMDPLNDYGGGDSRNEGDARGRNGGMFCLTYQEVAEAISSGRGHALRTWRFVGASPRKKDTEPAVTWVQPPAGDTDGKGDTENAPRQGARIRLKPSIDVDTAYPDVPEQVKVILRTLQLYGGTIHDSGGNTSTLEDTYVRTGVDMWSFTNTVIASPSQYPIELTDFEIIDYDYIIPAES